jgi:hypothetical protein
VFENKTKKIIKNGDVVFMDDSGSIRNDMEMRPSGRNEGPQVVVVDESSKVSLFDDNGQFVNGNEEVGRNEVAIKEARERPTNDDIIVEGFGEE